MRVLLTVSLLAIACSSDAPPPPTCQQAIRHYYSAGCTYSDLTTDPPTPIPESTFVANCQTITVEAPASCQDEIDAWLTCNNEVPSPAGSNEDCDCSFEFMALLRCE